MKFGQAMSHLRGRAARGAGRPVPRDADQAAGRGAADADLDRAPGPGRRARPALAPQVRAPSTTPPPPPRRSGRCTGPSGSDGRDVAVKVQYPGAGQALVATSTRCRGWPGSRPAGSPAWTSSRSWTSSSSRVAEELDYGLEAELTAAVRRGLRGRPRLRHPARWSHQSEQRHRQRVAGRRAAVRRSSPRGTPGGARRGRRALPGVPAGRSAASGLLHADPHPGNFRLLPDGRLGVLDFGAVNRLPDGLPRRWDGCSTLALKGDAEARGRRAARGGLRQAQHRRRRRGAAGLPRAVPRPAARRRPSRFTRAWLRGLFGHLNDPRRPQWHGRPEAQPAARRTC